MSIDKEEFQRAIEEEFADNEEKFHQAMQELENLIYEQDENSEHMREVLFNFLVAERLTRACLKEKTNYVKGDDLSAFLDTANALHNELLKVVKSPRTIDFRPFRSAIRNLPSEERKDFIDSLMDLILSIREGIICALPVSPKIKNAFIALKAFE